MHKEYFLQHIRLLDETYLNIIYSYTTLLFKPTWIPAVLYSVYESTCVCIANITFMCFITVYIIVDAIVSNLYFYISLHNL